MMVVDVTTGRVRSLLGGMRVDLPDWSPALRALREEERAEGLDLSRRILMRRGSEATSESR